MTITDTTNQQLAMSTISTDEFVAFYDTLGHEKRFIGDPRAYRERIAVVFGMYINQKLGGVSGFKRYYKHFYFTFHIIKAEYQGKGYSKILTHSLIEHAKKMNLDFFMGSTHVENTLALNAWLKQGYHIVHKKNGIYRLFYPLNKKGRILLYFMPFACSVFSLFKRSKPPGDEV